MRMMGLSLHLPVSLEAHLGKKCSSFQSETLRPRDSAGRGKSWPGVGRPMFSPGPGAERPWANMLPS